MAPIQSMDDLTSRNIAIIARMEEASRRVRTRGDRLADAFATVIGSWTFIVIQTIILLAWMTLNLIAWIRHWDPYPFILLNLALSFQSAYAAPILMMSQNRQGRLTDRRHNLDLQVNMLAEQETTEILRLLRLLCERHGVAAPNSNTAVMEEDTRHEEIIERLEVELEQHADDEDRIAEPGATRFA